jgi:alpha-beta hydrolase superfamily lysophospholipase
LVHGLAEHSGRYMHLVDSLVAEDYVVYGLDCPGHGRSEGIPGYVQRFSHLVAALGACLETMRAQHVDTPLFLAGHSIGSLICVNYLLDHPDSVAGAVFSSTSIQVPDNVTPLIALVAKLLSALIPRLGLATIESSWISRDPAVVQAYLDDSLVYKGRISARVGAEIIKAQRRAMAEAYSVTEPILMLHGGDDRLAPPASAQVFYSAVRSADKTLKVYEGLYHDLYNEPERDQVLSDVIDWLEARVSPEL